MVKNKGGSKILKYFKNLIMISAMVFIEIAENSASMMCVGFMDEIELPEEINDLNFLKK